VKGSTEQGMDTTIEQTFLHVPGVGPVLEAKIKEQGYHNWQAVLRQPKALPLGTRTTASLLQTLTHSQNALEQNDISYFIDHFSVKEQWRILAAYFDRISYFDIETSGLSYDAYVTCIVCYHQGQLHQFIHGENLDDFLDLLEEVRLLVSFNGSSFDIPHLLRAWHIPEFPCPHIDLRWQCYHDQLRGGLKQVENELGIIRPQDLQGVDGADAVWLWLRWKQYADHAALERLLRYCAADVLTLQMVTSSLLSGKGVSVQASSQDALWRLLAV
jgi:uncharacterized protein YprB with RNaseH-like and TPR domain